MRKAALLCSRWIGISLCLIINLAGCRRPADQLGPKLSALRWVDYSPSHANPDRKIETTFDDMRKDLITLRNAGFTGLVTYGANGRLGKELPSLAQSLGFKGLIVGIWDPASSAEIQAAKETSQIPIVVGYCVGNEGLGTRYSLGALTRTMSDLRSTTGKPVTTTEIIEKYKDTGLKNASDWLFPNVHPYWHGITQPDAAVAWTVQQYSSLKASTDKPILFKEVGLPTSGDPKQLLSNSAQARYYGDLKNSSVLFVYFEAFDQPWKVKVAVEPHWGLFTVDRTPKEVVSGLNP